MKTNMRGNKDNYDKMFKTIKNWDSWETDDEDDCYLFHVGMAMGDAPFHGWVGEELKNEMEIYEKIETSYLYLLKSLAEAIGYEFPVDSPIWKYHLKDIDTNNILKVK